MCRMLIASGDFKIGPIIDGAIRMASDQNSVHELNEKNGPGSWIHEDGWGVAYLNNKNQWVIKKSIKPIFNDPSVKNLKKIKTKLLVLHMRKKAGSQISVENTHPFMRKLNRKQFVFCHNGFIKEHIQYDHQQFETKGETDSERLFYSILTDFKKGKPERKEKQERIEEAVRDNFQRYKKIAGTNIILTTKNKAVVALRRNRFPRYYQMHLGKSKDAVIISSEILDLRNFSWRPLEPGDILSLNHQNLKTRVSKKRKNFLNKAVSHLKKAKKYKIKTISDIYQKNLKKIFRRGNKDVC